MLILMYAAVTVLAWGTWIGLADAVVASDQVKTFYVTLGNLAFAALVLVWHGDPASWLWLPFAGGLLWAFGNVCAFQGSRGIGLARASGIWTCLNIAMGLVWGAVLFDEFVGIGARVVVLWLSLASVMAGLLLIVLARGNVAGANADPVPGADGRPGGNPGPHPDGRGGVATVDVPAALRTGTYLGLAGAFGAGLLWGSYFIPIQLSDTSLWVANLSLAAGMFVGGTGLAFGSGRSFVLEQRRSYLVLSLAGALWGIGNIGMLTLVEEIGTGKGFAIAQLSLVVKGLIGIVVFRNPPPRSRAAAVTFAGIMLAVTGGILLGQLK
jgi:glucose uptake protein